MLHLRRDAVLRLLTPAVLFFCLLSTHATGQPAGAAPTAPAAPATPTPPATPAPPGGEMIVAIYLPGLYFAQLDGKVALGAELAAHLSRSTGRPAAARVYATAAALETDIPRITIALVEATYVATRMSTLTPLCTASVNGKEDTHFVVLSGPSAGPASLRGQRLAYAALPYQEQPFLENFVFEGELRFTHDRLEPARDAASALSKISLKKADAVLLYEDDVVHARGLRPTYESGPLPRPTVIVFDDIMEPQEVQRLREIMTRFTGHTHPQFQSFRPAVADRYEKLLWHIQRNNQRLPPLVNLMREDLLQPRLPPAAPTSLPLPPLKPYAQ